jgi:hypothetical protein
MRLTRDTPDMNYDAPGTRDGNGIIVVVDGHYVLDDGLHLDLEVYELVDASANEVVCNSEEEIHTALVSLGAFQERAAETAKRLWAEASQYIPQAE